ncbi:hypothetical protein PGTUg99_032431 [Puccinia graminis f. sp. tritici]|uniref:Uncharacterized protein n=1 Tax=Puccinia graminis f. sp. tritici TaxID=56615 RepID=A0A5B0PQZ0_PUCGR|nr:hypothetical protein PGTUg99_032431 [Puccinia graminis f. sp. tritici]
MCRLELMLQESENLFLVHHSSLDRTFYHHHPPLEADAMTLVYDASTLVSGLLLKHPDPFNHPSLIPFYF